MERVKTCFFLTNSLINNDERTLESRLPPQAIIPISSLFFLSLLSNKAAKPRAPAPSTKVLSFSKNIEIACSIELSLTSTVSSTSSLIIFKFFFPILLTATPSAIVLFSNDFLEL